MSQTSYDILGVRVDALTSKQVLTMVERRIKESAKPAYITKPYVEFLASASSDEKIRTILNQSWLCLADGVSLQWAASFLYGKPKQKHLWQILSSGFWRLQNQVWRSQCLPEKMAGVNLTVPLLKLAESRGWKVGVIGGPENTNTTQNGLEQIFPNLNLSKVWSGYYIPRDEAAIVSKIAKQELDILFVAMGFPGQERFMSQYLSRLRAKILIGEGGSFDYQQLGGSIKRAPKWMQKLGLEWFWRLVQQPSRIGRQLAIFRFVWLVYLQAKRQAK